MRSSRHTGKLMVFVLCIGLVNIALLLDTVLFSEAYEPSRQRIGNFIEKEITGNRLLSSVLLQNTHGDNSEKILEEELFESDLSPLSLLPHLTSADASSLEPLLFTQRNETRRKIAFCIPVVWRQEAYILETLRSLLSLNNLEEEFRHDVVFIVMFAFIDTAVDSFNTMIEDILGEFRNEIQTGLLEVAAIPSKWYDLEFDAIQPTFNDSPERMQWRTKQNLDYIYLMNYGSRRADYYMQLEDDIKATSRYGRIIFDYIKFKQDRPWFIMQFSTLGAIGRLYRSEDVKYLTYAIALYYRYKPVDWILYSVENSRYCSSYGDLTHCKQDRDLCSVSVSPPLFQHIGKVSSLSGKAQKLRERYFEKTNNKSKRGNPSAKITSTMHHYREFTAQAGYDKEGYMWFIDVKQNDSLTVEFEKPARITRMLIISGVGTAPLDQFGPETKLLMQYRDGKRRNLGQFSNGGDFIAELDGWEISSLQILVTASKERWVNVGYFSIDVALDETHDKCRPK